MRVTKHTVAVWNGKETVEVVVTLEVDEEMVARRLVGNAYKSKGKKSTVIHESIVLRID